MGLSSDIRSERPPRKQNFKRDWFCRSYFERTWTCTRAKRSIASRCIFGRM